MATTADYIKSALSRITAYQPGDQLDAVDANDALIVFNDLLDSLLTDHATVYASNEVIIDFVPLQYQYTIGPGGDFSVDTSGNPIQRPLRITNGFTRFSGIDFYFEVTMDQARYAQLLLKTWPSPWPLGMYYNPTWPLGTLYFYPNPSDAAEMHLFVDVILQNVTLNQTISLPQGYARALKWLLARELCAEYGYPITDAIKTLAKESLDLIKSLNQDPQPTSSYDSALMGNKANASWILTGGFNS